MTLDELAKKYHCDKQTGLHGYTPYYEKYFEADRLNYKNVLEIGVWDGRSLHMWQEYFPNAMIYGADNMNAVGCLPPEHVNDTRINYFVGKQEDQNFLDAYFGNILFDLIIDDASHQSWSHQLTFKYMFHALKSGGLYIIEDLDTCLLREFREHDDIRSSTTSWLESIMHGRPYSYYMNNDAINDVSYVELFNTDPSGQLGVIHKK